MTEFADAYLAETDRDPAGARPSTRSMPLPAGLAAVRDRAGGCSSSASAARPATPATRSTTSASCAASRPTRRRTTSRELTARINDEGWDTSLCGVAARLAARGRRRACWSSPSAAATPSSNISANLVRAIEPRATVGAKVFGIVGRDGGYTAQVGRRRAWSSRRCHAERITPAHRGAVRRRLAPARQPPGAAAARPTKWERSSARPMASERHLRVTLYRVRHRRRRRLHRQPLHRPRCSPRDDVERVTRLRQLHLRPALALRAARRRPAARRSSRGDVHDLDRADRGDGGPRRRSSTWRRNPDIARGDDRTRHRLPPGHAAHPPRRRGRCGGRRSRSILYASGSGVYGDLGELEADEDHGPLDARVDLRRQQARRRGADLRPTPTCSGCAATRLPLRQRRRPAADARRRLRLRPPAASTTRRDSRILGDGTAEQVVHPRRRRGRAVLLAGERGDGAVRGVQRGDGRLHHGHARSPTWRRGARASRRRRSSSRYTGGDRGLEGRRAGGAASPPSGSAASAGRTATARARRCAARCVAMLDDARAGKLW